MLVAAEEVEEDDEATYDYYISTLTFLTAAGTLLSDHPFGGSVTLLRMSPFCACHPFGGSTVGGQFRGRGGNQTTYYS